MTGFVPVAGASLYYESVGEGPPIVFLHGFSLDLRMWEGQMAAFAEKYQVIRYDLRGFGRSKPGTVPYTHADDLAALLQHLKIEKPALMGLSMGGGAALNFAIAFPNQRNALIVADPSLGGYAWSPAFTGS